jgi:MraZ protein
LVFRGTAYLSLDAKGRLAIPSKFRERLLATGDANLILTVDRDRCLLLFPIATWESIEREFSDLPAFDEAARKLQRLYVGNAEDVEMDAQGRILLAQHLRDFARLEKRVAMVGQGLKFEIWNEQEWRERSLQDLDNPRITELALTSSSLGKLKF